MIDLQDAQGATTARFSRPGAWQQGLAGNTASYGYGSIESAPKAQAPAWSPLQSAQFGTRDISAADSVSRGAQYGADLAAKTAANAPKTEQDSGSTTTNVTNHNYAPAPVTEPAPGDAYKVPRENDGGEISG